MYYNLQLHPHNYIKNQAQVHRGITYGVRAQLFLALSTGEKYKLKCILFVFLSQENYEFSSVMAP